MQGKEKIVTHVVPELNLFTRSCLLQNKNKKTIYKILVIGIIIKSKAIVAPKSEVISCTVTGKNWRRRAVNFCRVVEKRST